MSVTFSDVWLSYGEREVLRGIDLELTEHRVGIVGANGSGKSSLARLVNGLVRPTRGRVVVDGVDVARNTAAVRRRVGFLFSDADSQIVMPTVREDLEFSLRGRGLAAPELALAAVLLLEPAIVVADEPTTLLDLRNQRRFADRLAALPQQVLLATHHLELLAGFDRVVVLDQGRVVADGAAQEAVAAYLRLLVDVPTADGAPVAEGRS
jgi:biotin transport system ATP-binding protein